MIKKIVFNNKTIECGYILSLLLLYISFFYFRKENALLVVGSAVVYFMIHIIALKNRDTKNILQFTIIDTLGAFFGCAMAVNCILDNSCGRVTALAIAIGAGLLVVDFIIDIIHILKHRNDISLKFEKKDIPILILIVVVAILSLEAVGVQQKWDSGVYMNLIIDRHAYHYFQLLKILWCGHITQGYLFVATAMNSVLNDLTLCITLTNYLFFIFSVYAFYSILRHLYPNQTRINTTLTTAIYSFSPYIFGMLGVTNCDYPLTFLFILMLWCHIKEYRIGFIFFSAIFAFTKEPAALMYATFIGSIIVCDIIKSIKEKKFYVDVVTVIHSAIMGISWLKAYTMYTFWGSDIVTTSAKATNNNINSLVASASDKIILSILKESTELKNCFAFDFDYIKEVAENIFVLNFNWFFSIMLVVSVLYLIFRKKFDRYCLAVLMCYIVNLAINLLYITSVNVRYMSIQSVFHIFFLALLLMNIKEIPSRLVATFISVIMLISSYICIDPISYRVFGKQDMGTGISTVSTWYSDNLTINRGWIQYSKCLNDVVGQIVENNPEAIIYFPETQGMESRSWAIGGVFSEEGLSYYKKQISVLPIGQPIVIKYLGEEKDVEKDVEKGCEVWYVEIPSYGEVSKEYITNNYEEYDRITSTHMGWRVEAVRIN